MTHPIELRTEHLLLRPLPPAAAARLPGDRAVAAELLGATLVDMWPLPEIDYSFVPSRRRRGYATEAARALVEWALDQPGVTAILAGTDPDNDVSRRVLERAGFDRTGSTSTEIRWRRPRGIAGA